MIVRQVAHLLDLLEYFAHNKKPMSLAEVSEAMGWPRSSTFNLLTTLTQRGYLYEPRVRSGFYPSRQWTSVVNSIMEGDLLPEAIYDAVEQVAKTTGETVAVAAPAGINAVFLHVVESTALVRFSARIGWQIPIHATSAGRALLAQFSPRERTALLKKVKFSRYARQSMLSAEEVESEIKHAAKRGWHESIDGHSQDLTGIAIPLALNGRRLSIVVGGPTSRMKPKIPKVAAALSRVVNRLHAGQNRANPD